MSTWLRNGLWILGAAALIYALSICNALARAGNSQPPSDAPDVRSGQGQPCGSDADCATGLTCFNNGRINFCTKGGPQLLYQNEGVVPARPAKTCNTASDCGPGDWTCSRGVCGYTGEKLCSTNADCHGGWVCTANGNGHACWPPQP